MWGAVGLATNQCVAALTDAKRQDFFRLLALPPAKLRHGKGRKGDASGLVSLGWFEPDRLADLFKALHYPKGALVKVDAPPSKGANLASPHSSRKRNQHRPIHPTVLQRREELVRLLWRQRNEVFALDLGQSLLKRGGGIASKQWRLMLHRPGKRRIKDPADMPSRPWRKASQPASAVKHRDSRSQGLCSNCGCRFLPPALSHCLCPLPGRFQRNIH